MENEVDVTLLFDLMIKAVPEEKYSLIHDLEKTKGLFKYNVTDDFKRKCIMNDLFYQHGLLDPKEDWEWSVLSIYYGENIKKKENTEREV